MVDPVLDSALGSFASSTSTATRLQPRPLRVRGTRSPAMGVCVAGQLNSYQLNWPLSWRGRGFGLPSLSIATIFSTEASTSRIPTPFSQPVGKSCVMNAPELLRHST